MAKTKTRKKSAAVESSDDVAMACPKCEADVTSDQLVSTGRGIQCETCDKWYHAECIGWSEDQYKFVASNECIHFSCENCDGTGLNDNENEADPSSGGTSEHITNRTSYAKAVAQGNTIEAKIIRHITSVSQEERMRRCLVFSGMPEEGNDLNDASALCQKLDPSATVCETFRMGTLNRRDEDNPNKPRGPRILKVVFPSSSVAKSILMEAKSLSPNRDLSDYKSIFIRKSMSYEERKKLFNLRQQRDGLNAKEDGKTTRVHYAVVKNEVKRFINCELGEKDRLVRGTLDEDWSAPPPPPPVATSKNGAGGRNPRK